MVVCWQEITTTLALVCLVTPFKRIFAYTFGSQADESLKILLDRLNHVGFSLFCTDDWGAYMRLLPKDKHLITKRYTQSIERQNLNLRTWI